MNIEVDHVDVRVYGPRNSLLGQARIPKHLIPDFIPLLVQAKTINPIYDPGLLMRWIVKLGYKAVAKSLRRGSVEFMTNV